MGNYGMLISVFIFAVLLFIVIKGHWFPAYKEYKNTVSENVNHDAEMRTFLYRTKLNENQIIQALRVRNTADALVCEIDEEHKIMKFSEYGSFREYYYCITRQEDDSVLVLEQVAPIGMQGGLVPFKLNSFVIAKLDAEASPYEE